ncbi:mandelate racemase/muconate lactonizing enzyme family protein [Chloroflexota bacterium]
MRITEIRTISLSYDKKFPPIPRIMALVRIETDSGLVGYGEACTSYGHFYPKVMEAIVEDPISRAILGKDPLDIQSRLRDMKLYVHPWLGWDGIAAQVIGAVEIALWDILGKAKETPIAKLFGAHLDRVPLYSTGSTYPERGPAWHGMFFDRALELGFVGVKTRIANGVEADVRQIAGVREHVGPDIRLMADAYWTYSPSSAIKLAKQVSDYDLFWLEEAIPQYMVKGLARLTAESAVPIAVGERVYSLPGFELVIDYAAADILQPDACVCGGIMEAMEVNALAKANDLRVYPHIGGLSAVGMAANLHLAAIIGSDMLEYDFSPHQPLRDELLHEPLFDLDHLVDGCLKVPDEPGLGIQIDESVFDKYPFKPGLKIYPDIYPQLGAGRL